MENNLRQLKLDLYSDCNSCHDFLANHFRVLLSSIAYILLIELKSVHLKKTNLAKAYCGTVQLKLLKIGVMIFKNTRNIKFLLASHCPYQNDFITAQLRGIIGEAITKEEARKNIVVDIINSIKKSLPYPWLMMGILLM
jgi:hypothetical protein